MKMNDQLHLLGGEEFGQEPERTLNPLVGVAVGGGVSFVTAAAMRLASHDAAWDRWSEAAGFAAGGALSGAMLLSKKTRTAGWAGLAAAALSSGLRLLETLLSKPADAAASGEPKGVGYPVIHQLGLPHINYLNGLGTTAVASVPVTHGTVAPVPGHPVTGTAGVPQSPHLGPPVDLVGPAAARPAQARLIAGPSLPTPHGIASAYVANLFGGMS